MENCHKVRSCYFYTYEVLNFSFSGSSRMNDIRVGSLVGTDKFGNKYYENKSHFFGESFSQPHSVGKLM